MKTEDALRQSEAVNGWTDITIRNKGDKKNFGIQTITQKTIDSTRQHKPQ